MTAYWKEWKEIVFKAKKGNSLALVALYNLIDALPKFDHSTTLGNWLERQDFLHRSVMLITCEHTFFPVDEAPGFVRCVFCGNTVHKALMAQWKEMGWIRETSEEEP